MLPPQSLADHDLAQDIVLANRILANEGVLDSFGHVSVRDPEQPDRYLISRSCAPERVGKSDIQRLTIDGDYVDGDPRRSYAEKAIHGAIYRARPDANAVCHNHSPSVLPFSVTGEPLRPVFHLGSVIGQSVPVWDTEEEFGATDLLVRTNPLGDALARTLGEARVALMRGHGSVVCGRSIKELVFIAIYMERNAALLLAARSLGRPKLLSREEVELAAASHLVPEIHERAWENWVGRLPQHQPLSSDTAVR